jgi:hypothetical protein
MNGSAAEADEDVRTKEVMASRVGFIVQGLP